MDRHLLLEAQDRAASLRPVPASRCSSVAKLFPWAYYTTVLEYQLAPRLTAPNAAAEAVAYGLQPHLISDEGLLRGHSPFVLVDSIGIETVRLLVKWRRPTVLVPLHCSNGLVLVSPDTLLVWG